MLFNINFLYNTPTIIKFSVIMTSPPYHKYSCTVIRRL
nr:MAG TPA_asm: hypothetical protein [Caudoviricetes sp.]